MGFGTFFRRESCPKSISSENCSLNPVTNSPFHFEVKGIEYVQFFVAVSILSSHSLSFSINFSTFLSIILYDSFLESSTSVLKLSFNNYIIWPQTG